LKTYQITVNGQHYTVEVDDLDASPIEVTVDGHPFQVTIDAQAVPQVKAQSARGDEPALQMDAYVPSVSATYQEIDVADLDVAGSESPAQGADAAQQAADGAITVSAPMPGTILDIAVQPGTQVSQGDTLCNLEAMKMKSPIRSPGDGTVAQILVTEGQNVAFGDTLFTLN
jgi:biotin carboxyl carrier protein